MRMTPLGLPKGVSSETSPRSEMAGMLYKPDPPITAIRTVSIVRLLAGPLLHRSWRQLAPR